MHSNKEERFNFCNASTFERGTLATIFFFAGNLSEVYETNLTKIGHMVVALVRINSFHTFGNMTDFGQIHIPNISPWTNWSRMCPILVIFTSHIPIRNIAMYF